MVSATPVVLITGANQGIGYSIAELLSQSKKPYHILVGARNPSRGEEATKKLNSIKTNSESTVSFIEIDITSSDSVSHAVSGVSNKHGRLDILVNNAAIAPSANTSVSRHSQLESIFNTNVVGTVVTTEAFLPLLEKSSDPKVVVISSSMGSITMAENSPLHPMGLAGTPYKATKSAINMFLVEWAKYWKGKLKVWGVDPGLCATDFAGDYSRNAGRDPKEGADIARQCIEEEREDCIGKVVWEQHGQTGIRAW